MIHSIRILLMVLSAAIGMLMGVEYLTEPFNLFIAVILYSVAHYLKYHFTYRQFTISARSKPLHVRSIPKVILKALINVIFFIFIGYILLEISKTTIYQKYLQSFIQGFIDFIEEVLRLWAALPVKILKYGQ